MVQRTIPAHSLPHSTVVPHTRETRRLVTRLGKTALITVAQRWLGSSESVNLYAASLEQDPDGDDEDQDSAAQDSLEAAVEEYNDLARSPAIRAKDVAEHMLENEWRNGFSLLGIAELEWQHLLDHPASSKWQSFILAPLTATATSPTPSLRPRFHTHGFLASLQSALRPIQTAHFFAAAHPALPLTAIRVSLHDPHTPTTYPQGRHSRRLFWLAFPGGADHVFTTLGASRAADGGLRDVVVAGIANAVSRQGCRFELKPGRLIAKTLQSLCAHRGAEGGAAGGMAAGWSIYVDGFECSPLAAPREVVAEEFEEDKGRGGGGGGRGAEAEDDPGASKRRKLAAGRFGATRPHDGTALESVYFEVQEKCPGNPSFRPTIGVQLEGSHVFAGVREMAEKAGHGFAVDRLPGWIVGAEGVSSGIVRDGKVLRKRGDGRFNRF